MRVLIAAIWLLASVASAQESPSLELALDEPARAQIDADALESALARELEVSIARVDESSERGADRTRLTVHGLGRTRVRLDLVRADATTLRRTTRLHPDPDERIATLVILAANLVRDEAGELLAMLRRPPPEPVVIESEPVVVESEPAVESEVEAEVESEVEAESEVEVEVEVESEVEVEDEVEPEPEPEPEPESPPRDPFLRLGVTSALGSFPRPGGADLAWLAGLEVSVTPLPFLAIGIRELGGAYAASGEWNVGGAVHAELAWRPTDWFDLHGAVGVHLQYITDDTHETAGAAPLVLAGARLYADRIFSIAIDTAFRFVATHSFHVGTTLVPEGAVLWTGGLSFTFHIS